MSGRLCRKCGRRVEVLRLAGTDEDLVVDAQPAYFRKTRYSSPPASLFVTGLIPGTLERIHFEGMHENRRGERGPFRVLHRERCR